MRVVNNIMNALGEIVFAPFTETPPWGGLVVVSLVAGLGMMIVFKYTSRQAKLKAVSDRTRANLLAMKLFKDELAVTFASQGDLLKATGLRLWYSLWPPMAVMIIPFVLAIAQLGVRYEHRPLAPGESALVTLTLRPNVWEANRNVQLETPAGVAIDTPALRLAEESAIQWRVRATEPGEYTIAWQIDGQRITKSLPAGSGLAAVSPRRPTTGLWDQLLYPIEPPLAAASPVRSIDLELPPRSTPIFGLDVHWLITFFVLSMLFALILKPFLKVQL